MQSRLFYTRVRIFLSLAMTEPFFDILVSTIYCNLLLLKVGVDVVVNQIFFMTWVTIYQFEAERLQYTATRPLNYLT